MRWRFGSRLGQTEIEVLHRTQTGEGSDRWRWWDDIRWRWGGGDYLTGTIFHVQHNEETSLVRSFRRVEWVLFGFGRKTRRQEVEWVRRGRRDWNDKDLVRPLRRSSLGTVNIRGNGSHEKEVVGTEQGGGRKLTNEFTVVSLSWKRLVEFQRLLEGVGRRTVVQGRRRKKSWMVEVYIINE